MRIGATVRAPAALLRDWASISDIHYVNRLDGDDVLPSGEPGPAKCGEPEKKAEVLLAFLAA